MPNDNWPYPYLQPQPWPAGVWPSRPQPVTLAGWACPGCLRCYAPSVTACPDCPQAVPAAEPLHDLCITSACPPPAHGGMCGCDNEDGRPRDCMRARCDC